MYDMHLEGWDTLKFTKAKNVPTVEDYIKSGLPLSIFNVEINEGILYGGEIVHNLYNSAPLVFDKKHILFRMGLLYLSPNYLPIFMSDWHIDGFSNTNTSVYDNETRLHILIGDGCDLRTEFSEKPLSFQVPDHVAFDFVGLAKYMTDNIDITPKQIDTGTWVTFTNRHVHRVGTVTEPQWRFFVEFRETDFEYDDRYPHVNWEDGTKQESVIFRKNRTYTQFVCAKRTDSKTVKTFTYE